MAKSKRIRRIHMEVVLVEVEKSWSESTLKLRDWTEDGERKEVIIHIRGPYFLRYLRERLTELAEGWKAQVKDV